MRRLRLLSLLSLLGILISSNVKAQLEYDVCPEEIHCLGGVFEVQGHFPNSETYDPAFELCDDPNAAKAGLAALRFDAVSSYLQVSIFGLCFGECYFSCGIKDACTGECVAFEYCNPGVGQFDTDNIIPGREYIVYVSICYTAGTAGQDFELTLTEGPDETDYSIESFELSYLEECSSGGSEFCCSEDMFLRIETEDPEWNELLQNKKGIWRIEIEGEVSEEMEAEDLYSFDFCSLPYGEYELTLKEFEHACGIEEYDLKYSFSIIDVTEDFGEGLVCQHELDSGFWKPKDWEGEAIEEEGDYHHVYFNNCNCPVDQYVSLVVYQEEYIEHELELNTSQKTRMVQFPC